MYIYKITDSTGDIAYMIHCKGISQESIRHAYENEFNNNPMDLYKYIYDGNSYTFDLTNGEACFEMKNDMSVITKEHFTRKIKATYDEGTLSEYFYNISIDLQSKALQSSDNISIDETIIDILNTHTRFTRT